MTVADKKKKDCCGCNACAEICPKQCIKMLADNKGFLYPNVNATACTACGACERVCPMSKSPALTAPAMAFAAWSKDRAQHLTSSSGGAAHVLSTHIINSGGVVYGCTSHGMKIRHIRVEGLQELPKLQGSKYVQSNVCGLYSQVKADLKAGRQVLFIGTPCQVAGLKKYMRNVPDGLYLVDLICHGVPSQQMLHEHIAHVAKKRDVRQVSFRKGNDYLFTLTGDDFTYEANLWQEPFKDMYTIGFIESIICRPSCYQCPFSCPDRVADITIGDFWGLQHADELPPESKDGISVLLPTTEKGIRLIDAIKPRLCIVERSVDEAVKGNCHLQHSSEQRHRGRLFSRLYPLLPFDIAMSIVLANKIFIRKIKDIIYALRHVGSR